MNEPRQVDKGVLVNPARWALAGYVTLAAAYYGQILKILPPVICPLKWIAHVPCPGCGATRAFLLTLQGQWLGALKINPMGFFLAFAAVLIFPGVVVLNFYPHVAHRWANTAKRACGTWWFRGLFLALVGGTWGWVFYQHLRGAFHY